MGRVKLKIKRLANTSNRQMTYSKRRSGILKKAKELSILCDVDVVLLMFSPTGRATLLQGERSNIEDVISKFAQLSPQERAKRKLESLEALRKTFKKLDHDVRIQDFLGSSGQMVEDLSHQVRILQAQITEVHKRLSYWSNPEKIHNVEQLRQMEDLLRKSINGVCQQKENLGKRPLFPLESTSQQLEDGMSLAMVMGRLQEGQKMPWFMNHDNQHIMLRSEPKLLSYCASNRATECSTDVSLPFYSNYFGNGKQLEFGNSTQSHMGQGADTSNDLNRNDCFSIQLAEQFAYSPYSNQAMSDDILKPPVEMDIKHQMEMNFKPNHVAYQVNSNGFDLSRSIFENGQSWTNASGPCGVAMYNENSFHR